MVLFAVWIVGEDLKMWVPLMLLSIVGVTCAYCKWVNWFRNNGWGGQHSHSCTFEKETILKGKAPKRKLFGSSWKFLSHSQCLKVWTPKGLTCLSGIQKLLLLSYWYPQRKEQTQVFFFFGWQPGPGNQRDEFCSVSDDNVALGKPAYQSTTRGWGGAASRAVDGDANPIWNQNTCSHTDPNVFEPGWLVVDLLGYSDVCGVTLTNREDCCGMKLSCSFDLFNSQRCCWLWSSEWQKLLHPFSWQTEWLWHHGWRLIWWGKIWWIQLQFGCISVWSS